MCNEGYTLNWTTNTCEKEVVVEKSCSCFQGPGNPEGAAYNVGDEVISLIDGERKTFIPCTEEKQTACMSCTQPGWIPDLEMGNSGGAMVCRPERRSCRATLYQGCNFTGKECHISWDSTRHAERDNSSKWAIENPDRAFANEEMGIKNPVLGGVFDQNNNVKNYDMWDPEQCDWIYDGIGSVKQHPYISIRGKFYQQFGCDLRIRAAENFEEDAKVLQGGSDKGVHDVECFKTSEDEVDKKIAKKVVAITREYRPHC